MEHKNKDKGVHLINVLKDAPDKDANVFKKFWHWAKHTSLKSSDELKSIEDKRLRTICQLGNIVFSLLSLGVFIPIYTRSKTNKKHAEELAKLNAQKEANSSTNATASSATTNSTSSADSTSTDKAKSSSDDFLNSQMRDNTAFKAFFHS